MGAEVLSSRAIIGMFYELLEQNVGSNWIDAVSNLFDSDQAKETYPWIGMVPTLREWIGGRHAKGFISADLEIENLHFEATLEVLVTELRRDKTGQLRIRLGELADRTNAHWARLLSVLLLNGESQTCYDGQYFFDTDHPVGSASVSNKITAVLSNATLAAAQAGYGLARTGMKKFKDEEGRSLNITPTVLLVGPALEDTARALLTNDKLADDKPNPYKGTAELVVDGRIESDTAWFLLDTSKPVKPFVYQPRKKPVFVSQTNPEAEDVFNLKKYKFGAEARAAAGYGFWQLGFGSTGAG